VAGTPVRRARREADEVVSWREHPELSTRPAFEVENDAAATHGAYSQRKVSPVAEEIGEQLPAVAPWCRSDAFAGARASLAWVEAQARLVRAYVDEHGVLDGEGKPRSAALYLDKLEARLGSLRGELALTPQSMGRLLGSLAQVASAGHDDDALASLQAEGRRILAARGLSPVPG
jgi:hypothetical protein